MADTSTSAPGPEVPSYESFRRHASFISELSDFGLTEREFHRFLALHGMESLGALGLGDTSILFATNAVGGYINYEAVCKICRVLSQRSAALQARTGTNSLAAAVASALDKSMRTNTELRTLRAAPLPEYMRNAMSAGASGTGHGVTGHGGGTGRSVTWHDPRASEPMTQPSRAGRFSRLALRPSSAITATSASPPLSPSPPKSRLDASGILNSVRANTQTSAALTAPLAAAAPDTGLMEPPAMLRETIPPPKCEFAKIRNMISGAQVMFNNGDLRNATNALTDIRQEWCSQLEEKAARSKREPPAVPLKPEVPPEGLVWLDLMRAALALSQGAFQGVEQALAAADLHYSTKQMGEQHPYKHITALCNGLLIYYQGNYPQALDAFEVCREMADTLSRASPLDPAPVRNNAAALNNKAVCLLLMGRRMEGVACLRAATALMKHRVGLATPAGQTVMRNMQRALKGVGQSPGSAVRPRSAPPSLLTAGSAPGEANPELISFLKKNMTLYAVQPSIPRWTTRVKVETGAKKPGGRPATAPAASSKGAKGKLAVKKKSVFKAMTTFDPPTYAAANVKLCKKPKKKKAATKKA